MSAGVLGSAAVACFAGGILPWISGEAVVAGATVLLPPPVLPLLVVACALGQLAAKASIYGLARWAPTRLPRRARSALDRARRLLEGSAARVAVVLFLSGATGMPPFYLVTLAAGTVAVPPALFLGASGAGVLARYAVIAGLVASAMGRLPSIPL